MCVARLQHQEELTWIRVYPCLSAVVFPLDIALGRRTENEPRINADTDTNLSMILEKETEAILSCAMEVSNILGHGLLEKPYENALAVEMRLRGIATKITRTSKR